MTQRDDVANNEVGVPGATRSAGSSSRALVLCACLAQVIIVLDTTIVAVALPDAQVSLGFADSGRQWTITAYTLAFGSLLLVGGLLSQRLGIRRSFMIGLAGFGAASLVGGVAPSLDVLVAARVAQGVAAALLAPTNLSLMNSAFPDKRDRAGAFAVFGAVAGAGAALGLVLGGVLTELSSWRACFIVNVPLVILTMVVATQMLRDAPGPARDRTFSDVAGLVLGSAGVFSLVLGLSRAEDLGWWHVVTLGWLAAGSLLLSSFVIRERAAPHPLLPLWIVRDAIRGSSFLVILMVGFAQMGTSIYLTFYLQYGLGYTPLRTGLAFLPMVGGLILAAAVSTRLLVPRFGLRVVYPLGASVLAAGFLWLAGLTTSDNYVGTLLGPMIVLGVGLGIVMAPGMSSATQGIGPEHSGLASAVANTSQQFGASLGVAFLSSFAARVGAEAFERSRLALAEATSQALTLAGVGPDSVDGAAIVGDLVAAFQLDAQVTAYTRGFLATASFCLAIALCAAVLLRRSRQDQPAAGSSSPIDTEGTLP